MRRLLLLPIFLLALACQEIEFNDGEQPAIANICGVEDPLEELPWLKERLQTYDPESMYCQVNGIEQGTYQKQAVYIIYVGGALCCTCGNVVYDCRGEEVLVCNWEEEKKISGKRLIWSR